MLKKLPGSTIERLSLLFQFCGKLQGEGITRVSSTEIGAAMGIPAHTIRKDINFLGEIGDTGSGYDVARLKAHLSDSMGFDRVRKTCIVGLGRLGSALLEYNQFNPSGFSIEAGFDSNINRLETIRTGIPVFPAYEIPEVVKRKNIELALLTVPAAFAQEAARALEEGGIRGIINFAPVSVSTASDSVIVRNMNVVNELRVISSLLDTKKTT